MNAFAIAGLFFVAIPAIFVGFFTLIKRRKKVHLLWSTFLFSVAWWGFGIYKFTTTLEISKANFWLRFTEIGVILIPVLLVHFVVVFLNLKRKLLLALLYVLAAVLIFFNLFTNYFINELYFAFNQFYYPIATPLYTFFIIIFILSVIYSIFELIRAYKKTVGIIRSQIKYLILAFFVGFSGGITSFPGAYKINIYPIWNATIFVSTLIVSYAILRYRLMDIRIVTRKIFVYFISAGFIYGIFFFLVRVFDRYFGGVFTSTAYLSGLVIAPLFAVGFLWFFGFIQKVANRYFFFSLYNYQETINNLSQKLNYLNDLDEIVNLIVDTVKQAVQLDRAGVLLLEENGELIHYRIAKIIGFNERNGVSLVQDNFLTKHLKETQKPLVKEELVLLAKDSKDETERKGFLELESNMRRIEASLCLPLMSSKKLIGIIVLGSKVSGDAYTKEDLELLSTLSFQAGIAIDNARLYKEIQDFNKTLQQKVDEQTKEIKKAYEVEKKARKELERLNRAKDQFIMATQHHLRTPLTSMQGYLDLIFDGSYGKVPEKLKETLKKFWTSTKNEIRTVNELLDISQFQLGKEVVRLEENINIETILKEIIEELQFETEKKNIFLKLEKPEQPFPRIKADLQKLKVALFNVVDNGIKYTQQGGVTIKIKEQRANIKIIIQDTGIGIPEEEINTLFEKTFERGKEAAKFWGPGKGIGLFLTNQIIKAHKGRIWAESEGKDKGSTFFIELPINNS